MHEYFDAINGIFETVGAIATWRNVLAIRRDRSVRGVAWGSMAFFALWGVWNLGYYPSLHQWLSTLGGAFLVAGNLTWVGLALKYRKPLPPASVPVANDEICAGPPREELFGQADSSMKSMLR